MLVPFSETLGAGKGSWDCALEAHALVYNISASWKLPFWKYLKYAISLRRKFKAVRSDLFPSSLRSVALLAIVMCTLMNYNSGLKLREAHQAGD